MKKNICLCLMSFLILIACATVFASQDKNDNNKTDITEILSLSHFIAPLPNQVLEGKVNIDFSANGVLSVEFYIRRPGSLSSIYLGRAAKQNGQLWKYLWQTDNYPNGDYNLYAETSSQYGRYESEAIKVIISNPQLPKKESKDKADEIIKQKEDINKKSQEEKSEDKNQLKKEIKDETIRFKEEIKPLDEEETEEIKQKAIEEINKTIEREIAPEIEKLDNKIEKITVAQKDLKELEKSEKKEEKKEEKEQKKAELVQLVKEKEVIKEDIIKKSEEILTKEEVKINLDKIVQNQPEKKIEVSVEKEKIKQDVTQQVEDLDQFLSNKETERYDKLKGIESKDSDNDGILDLEEIRLGTDLLNPDTDGDGYLDSDEVKHGYNPLIPSPGDKIIFEDPREKGEIKKEYEVTLAEAKILEDGSFNILLSGKGLPNSFVTIYIYSSLPTVVIAKTDANGNWSYLLDKPLEDGEHQVYVAVTNNKGEISHKSATKYFIQQAQAITYTADSSIFDEDSSELGSDNEKSLKMAYVFLGLSIIVFCAGVALMIIGIRSSRKELE